MPSLVVTSAKGSKISNLTGSTLDTGSYSQSSSGANSESVTTSESAVKASPKREH